MYLLYIWNAGNRKIPFITALIMLVLNHKFYFTGFTDSPIWKGDNLVKAEIGTENLLMSCDICSNPRPFEYEWYFEGVQIPGIYIITKIV